MPRFPGFLLRFLPLAAVLLGALRLSAEEPSVPSGWFLWPMIEPAEHSALDTSSLNPEPAGARGRITVRDGAFVTADGRPVRFFGVNIASDDAFPSEADAEWLARRLAKAGVNIARLHHLDNPWGVGSGGSLWSQHGGHRQPDPAQLDKLHRLIAVLARHGIYTNLNLKVSKTLVAADGLPPSVEQLPDFQKRVDFFDRRMIELQKEYARILLTTKNPYTGLAPIDDPAVAIIEINNENSLLGYFTRDVGQGTDRFPEPFRSELAGLWNAYLLKHYTSTAALAAAWRDPDDGAEKSLLASSARWISKVQPDSAATLAAEEKGFSVTVEKTVGIDWHVQIQTGGVALQDNSAYTLAFEARGRTAGSLGVGISNDTLARPDDPWRSLGLLRTVQIGTDWTSIRLPFFAHSVGDGTALVSFNVAAATNRCEVRNVRLCAGATQGGVRPGQSLEARNLPIPVEAGTRQWTDWIAFLASVDRSFAEEMRTFLRQELHVQAPLVCSQMNFTGLTALDREQTMDFADTHVYWEHPVFAGAGWDRSRWTIANSPMIATFGPRRFGELGTLAFCRVAGKPYSVSEYDHPAPSEYVCEMYPELSVFACRQDWNAVYAFDLGAYGVRNPDHRISGYFDQINHPAKAGLAPFATRVFREGLISPASAVAELRPGLPVWGEAAHFDDLWNKLLPSGSFDFLDCRLQVNDRPSATTASLEKCGQGGSSPARLISTPRGNILVASGPRAAVATGFLGGNSADAGSLRVDCARFGRDFATVAAVSLDDRPLHSASRILITVVARAENQSMQWNEFHDSVGLNWGHGPTIAESVPATISLAVDGPRKIFALKPDGTRDQPVPVSFADGRLSFQSAQEHHTLHYEVVAP